MQHPFPVCRFHRFGFLHVLQHPVGHLTINDRSFHNLYELLVGQASGFQPPAVESLAQIVLIILVQLAGQMQADFIDVPRQVHPAAHGLARTARIKDVGHEEILQGDSGSVNQLRRLPGTRA